MLVIRRVFSKNILSTARTISIRTLASESADANVVKSDTEDVIIPDITIPELVFSTAEKYPKNIAVECGETGKRYSLEEVRTKSITLGRVLRKNFKLKKDDVVAICLPNCPDFFLAAIGTMTGGMVVTTLNPIYTPDEIAKQLQDSEAKVIITQNTLYQTIQNATSIIKKKIPILTVKEKESDSLPEGAINFEELLQVKINDLPDLVLGKGSDRAFLPYSSGTTGLPKGVELLHSNLVANIMQGAHPDFGTLRFPGDYQDVIPMVLPMFHIYGFNLGIATPLYYAAKVVTLPKFTPETFISVLQNHRITHLFVVPHLLLYMTSSKEVKPEYFKYCRAVNSGAAPLGFSDEERFREKIGNKNLFIGQGYGLTETAPVVSFSPTASRTTRETGGHVGKLIPNTLAKVINPDDETGKALGPNETGEFLLKGPQVMKRYHNRPEETKNAFLDGWFRTGDMAYYNEEKFFFITDRLKELIKVKGYQVPPAELEALIRTYPSVDDVAVIGIPDPKSGEVPRAYVVPKKNQTFKSEELRDFVASKVAKYKHLAGGIAIVESIPKNVSGKIMRRMIKDQYQKEGI